jgi:hypothetical protein
MQIGIEEDRQKEQRGSAQTGLIFASVETA